MFISFLTSKLFHKLKWKKLFLTRKIISYGTIARQYSSYEHSLTQIVTFDDHRLQQHLQFLKEVYTTENRKDVEQKYGFSHEILHHIQTLTQEIDSVQKEIKELEVLLSDIKDEEEELSKVALSEQKNLKHALNALQSEVFELIIPAEVADEKDIVMELNAGVGGQEAMLFAKDMLEMYLRYTSWKGWKHEMLKYDTTDLGGIRCAHIGINGLNAYKILKYECGVHRVQRVPKTERSGRVHTSTMTVAVLPQPSEIDIVIHPTDIELEFKKSSGAGGQHVNTTDSCVRIYHKPSGIVTESQVSRDQHRNRAVAMTSLRAKLYERELLAATSKTASTRKLQIGTAARSEKVRTYNFVQDRITDHRAHVTLHNVHEFLEGGTHFEGVAQMLQQWSHAQSLTSTLNKYKPA